MTNPFRHAPVVVRCSRRQGGLSQHHFSQPKSGAGLSLLGVLVALAFAILVAASLAGLAERIGEVTQLSREQHIATFLAREGIELVRSLRDDNWLAAPRCTSATFPCPIKWRGDPSSTDANERRRAICNGTWMIDPLSDGTDPRLVAVVSEGQLFLATDGQYTHTSTGAQPTPYKRTVEITTPGVGDCGPTAGGGGIYDADDVLPPPPFQVKSTVAWTDRAGKARQVVLVEELYPWVKVR